MRPVFQWRLGTRSLELGKRTLIMGVVNVTPDSFSDGGKFIDPENAVAHAAQLLAEGADIIDVGGESTRPGARVDLPSNQNVALTPRHEAKPVVTAQQELERVLPVISDIKKRFPQAVISIDTYKAEVARAAIKAGAEIVNDVSGFRWDSEMARAVADLGCGAVLMHMRGRPEEWRTLPPPVNLVDLVSDELREWSAAAIRSGIAREHIVLDPGFGFGKSFDENYPLMAAFDRLHELGFPLLVGTSRKSFIGRTIAGGTGSVPPEERLYGTLASETALILRGAHILRTHDVKASLEAARIADAILNAG